LLTALDNYEDELEMMRSAIESGDGTALEKMFSRARDARAKWLPGASAKPRD
jgi:prephenate dehydrogenase